LGQTRVILVDMPQMLREIMRELVSHERDLEIVGEFGDQDAALQVIDGRGAAVLITSLNQSAHLGIANLLSKAPHLRVLAVSGDGRESFLYELRPDERPVGELSRQTFLAAVRGQPVDSSVPDVSNTSPR
jgi:hypothetical protein